MIFKERQKRAMDTMNHRNKEYLEKMNGPLPDGGEENQEIPVMVISALITFLPIILVIALIMIVSIKLLS